MRAYRIVLFVSGILVFFGLGLALEPFLDLPPFFEPDEETGTVLIPAGGSRVFGLNILGAGTISGSFSESTGRAVVFSIFNETGYRSYKGSGELSDSLLTVNGNSGDFFVAFPRSGKYYLVFEHGVGYEDLPIEVSFTAHLEGATEITLLLIGLPILSGGVALTIVGLLLRQRARSTRAAGASQVIDVLFFEGRRPPEG